MFPRVGLLRDRARMIFGGTKPLLFLQSLIVSHVPSSCSADAEARRNENFPATVAYPAQASIELSSCMCGTPRGSVRLPLPAQPRASVSSQCLVMTHMRIISARLSERVSLRVTKGKLQSVTPRSFISTEEEEMGLPEIPSCTRESA